MIIIKTEEEIEKMKLAGKILVKVHKELRNFIKAGISTMDIDNFCEKIILENGAKPEQKGYMGYPFATCTSVNDEICHGFPSDEVILKDGDLVTVDMVVNLDGWLADSAWSYLVGDVSDDVKRLYDVTKKSLYDAIAIVKPGTRLGEIGEVIQKTVEKEGFSVVKDFVGHGIGSNMHEDPQVLHYKTKIKGPRLQKGMVFTIEPMINMGEYKMKMDSNGWTSRTLDGSISCQFEHTLAVTDDGVEIITEQD